MDTPRLLLAILLIASCHLAVGATIPPDDERIQVAGCRYVVSDSAGVAFFRHSEAVRKMPTKESGFNPQKAATDSGIELRFRMRAPRAQLRFEFVGKENRGAEFGAFIDGTLVAEKKFWKTAKMPMVIELAPEDGSKTVRCSVALPSFAAVRFLGLDLPEGGELLPLVQVSARPVYVAMGDSISHGVGQGSASHRTWPFLLSRSLDYELYNLAVGGGKISLPTADMLEDFPRVDFISILIGYNDWCSEGKTVVAYREAYESFLKKVRRHHPNAEILCITPLYTHTTKSKKTGLPLAPFRTAVEALVNQMQKTGDKKLHLLKGETITDASFLRGEEAPQDPVHLGVDGARRLAATVHHFLKSESIVRIGR